MPDATYANIKPLIVSATQDGGSMRCSFKCAATGVTAEASASISHDTSLKGVAVESTKRNLWYSITSAISRMIYGAVGSNVAGHVAQDVAREAGRQGQTATQYSGAEKNAAVVSAFKQVQDQFTWDDAGQKWVGKPAE